MGYALIWLESLATALLLVAAVTAWFAWRSRPIWQRAVPIVVALVILAMAASLTWGIGFINYSGAQIGWFSYALIWTLGFLFGTVILLQRGFRQRDNDGPGARLWSSPKLALALAALVLVTWTTLTNMDTAVKLQLTAVRAEAGAKILALSPPRIADRDNAALVYQEAFAHMTPLAQSPKRLQNANLWIELSEHKHDPQDKETQEFIVRQQPALALLRQAAAMPACYFEHDYFDGADLLLPGIERLERGAFLLGLDARRQAAEGNARAALDDVAAMFGISRHINDPILISVMVSARVERGAAKTLEEVLSRTTPRAEDLARLTLDDKLSFARGVHRACQMEEWGLGISAYTLLAGHAGNGGGSKWLREEMDPFEMAILDSSFYRVFFLADDLAGYRRVMRHSQELAQRPYLEAVHEWDNKKFIPIIFQSPTGIIAKLIVPATNRAMTAAVEADAAHQLARVAVAAASYRIKNGKFPEKLADLVPQQLAGVPRDPFNGQPLRMKRDDKSLLLYSIGRDLKDDGGIAWDETQQRGDIVFRLR